MVVSITIVRGLAARLKRSGIDEATFCAEAGLEPSVLTDPTARIGADEFVRVIEAALELSRDPALGLHVGET